MSDKKNFLKKRLHKGQRCKSGSGTDYRSLLPETCNQVINFLLSRSCVKILVLEEILCVKPLKFWKRMGWFYIKRAEGTFVNDTYNHKMLDPMLYGILLDKNMRIDLFRFVKFWIPECCIRL